MRQLEERMYYQRLIDRKKGQTLYKSADDFLKDCAEYFEWVDNHPFLEEQIFQNSGKIIRADKAKMRPYTKKGLAAYLQISERKLNGYKSRGEDWEEALEMVEQIIYTQKFEGAASGFFNASLITRDLGLADKTEIGGIADAPPVSFEITPMASGTFLPPDMDVPEVIPV